MGIVPGDLLSTTDRRRVKLPLRGRRWAPALLAKRASQILGQWGALSRHQRRDQKPQDIQIEVYSVPRRFMGTRWSLLSMRRQARWPLS